MPTHLKRIYSIINELLLDLDTVPSWQSEPEELGLSQRLQSHNLSERSNQDTLSLPKEAGSQLSYIRDITLETSVSQRIKEGAF